MNLNWWQQVLLGVAFMFAFQAFKFGPSQAHYGVGRIALKWAFRAGGLLVSAKDKPWVTRGAAEPPSGRLAMFQNLMAGQHNAVTLRANQQSCLDTGRFSSESLAAMRAGYPSALQVMLGELVPENCVRPAEGFPAGSLWVDTDFAVEDDTAPALLVLHGGGGIMGSPRVDVPLAFTLHKATNFRALALAYPLAPEHGPGEAGRVVVEAIRRLAPRPVVAVAVSGGSRALLHALLEHGAAPRAAVLVSPMVAGRPELPSHAANEASDFFSRALLGCMQAAAYPPGSPTLVERDWSAAAAVPFFIQSSAPELLASDAELAAAKLRAAGARDVTTDVISHAPHAVVLFQDIVPEAAAAAVRIRDWIKEKVK